MTQFNEVVAPTLGISEKSRRDAALNECEPRFLGGIGGIARGLNTRIRTEKKDKARFHIAVKHNGTPCWTARCCDKVRRARTKPQWRQLWSNFPGKLYVEKNRSNHSDTRCRCESPPKKQDKCHATGNKYRSRANE